MKVLVFCPYYPPHIGGLESHADEFNKYLSQKGVDIFVFTPRLPQNTPEYENKYNNVKIIRFPAFEIIANYPLPCFWNLRFWKLFFDLFKNKFDIIISRTRFFNTSLLALFYAKIKRTRWIHIEHGSDFVQLSGKFKTFLAWLYDQIFGRLIFKLADLDISISEAVQKFVNRFDRRHSPVIYRGLDMGEINKIEPDYKIKEKYPGKLIISFAGRLYKWKGLKNSILAIKSFPPEIKKQIVFMIVGDGEDKHDLEKIAENDKAIIFTGNLPHEKAIGILKISDIYLHSSHSGGGLSTSLLEAMYCGCAIVATHYEGAEEIIKNIKNGFLVSSISRNELLPLIEKILKEINTLKIIANETKNYVAGNFSWQNNIKSYEKILFLK